MTDDPAEFWALLRRTTVALESAADQVLRAEFAITLHQFALLNTLEAHDCSINQQEAADLLGLNKASVSRQVDAATTAGLLEVSPDSPSRRERIHRLTPAGRDLVAGANGRLAALTAASVGDRRVASTALEGVITSLS